MVEYQAAGKLIKQKADTLRLPTNNFRRDDALAGIQSGIHHSNHSGLSSATVRYTKAPAARKAASASVKDMLRLLQASDGAHEPERCREKSHSHCDHEKVHIRLLSKTCLNRNTPQIKMLSRVGGAASRKHQETKRKRTSRMVEAHAQLAAQLAQAEQLYAVLAGRIANVGDNGEGFGLDLKTKTYNHHQGSTYNLDERFRAWGLFAQDSWRVKPSLTVNFGLRWDFTGDDYDLTGAYHNATPADIYGPSGVGNVFKPGTLSGTTDPVLSQNAHAYAGYVYDYYFKRFGRRGLDNNNIRLLTQLGPDTGFDSIGDWPQIDALGAFLNAVEREGRLPKMVLYNLNPADNYAFAAMAGNFMDGSVAGRIQFGSGWWFLDQKEAIEWQVNALSQCGLLARFVGMLTDSRSFMS